jgi:predicted transcriptional regulator
MSKTVTLRLDEKIYQLFRGMATQDNRSLSNFIETAALRFIEEHEYMDEFEMEEIRENASLNRSINRGLNDAKAGRGQFV